MLKYFPGPLEPVATMVIPGVVVGFLLLLPFVDRGDGRHPFRASRRWLSAAFIAIGIGVMTLTALGLADRPVAAARSNEDVLAVQTFTEVCAKCHTLAGEGGDVGPDLTRVGDRRDEASIRAVIEDASLVFGHADMPTFKGKLTDAQSDALARLLARR